ncbi:hypothetical protein [Legionella longbeachae]|uniref:Uncharacterized protein n=1 Tax=Legionella longbeachae serogroup 1 (strain NSW150) TaxID=661367 RepID=D3HNI6_LEGLN|nr:hypothetical protein [Legionella longbeachae]VEE00976.1 Uncharacterised protein [Legionella oakridgensis]HBD7399287.1 hypothetical protein [Legionella pneumophila]ARB92640.1 hypothetical protein A6J40_10830 [Legionella longbeachae]ARM34185.1 hypothetical protein B0B39_11895 [Legionella longbeachae]QIN30940.1 hypothetical protein GCB94_01700 [Legionella longbeachae]
MPHLDLAPLRRGELRLINPTSAKRDGFRLYLCTPVPYQENTDDGNEKELPTEIRFKANRTLGEFHIHEEIKKKNSAFCFQIIMNIVNQVILSGIPIKKYRHTAFIDTLWNGLNEAHKKEIVQTIYEKNPLLLNKKATVYEKIIGGGNNTREFFNLVCQNHPMVYPDTVDPPKASHVIYITNRDLNSKEGIDSLSIYMRKHPGKCCIVTKKNALLQVLNHHKHENQTITLTIFGHNNIDKSKTYLDWTLGTAGEELGKLLNKYSCIGHLDMFTCHSGSLNSSKLHNAIFYEKSTGKLDLTRSLSVYPQGALAENNPFETATLAYQIYKVVAPKIHAHERGPLAMTFSPVFIFAKDHQFIGTSHEYIDSFNETNPLLHYKKITTFIGNEFLFDGVCLSKSNHHKSKRHQAVLNNNEITQQKKLSTHYAFFNKLLSKSESNFCSQGKINTFFDNSL